MQPPEHDDMTRRAVELYASRLRAILEPAHHGEFIAIEPDSEDYFLAPTLDGVFDAAQAAYPDRLVYVTRVGFRAAVGIGCYP